MSLSDHKCAGLLGYWCCCFQYNSPGIQDSGQWWTRLLMTVFPIYQSRYPRYWSQLLVAVFLIQHYRIRPSQYPSQGNDIGY